MIKRGKRKFKTIFTQRDMFREAKENFNFSGTEQEFAQILKDSVQYIMGRVLEDSDEYKFPHKLGTLRIKRRKNTLRLGENGEVNKGSLKINYKASWDFWKKQYPGLTEEEIVKIPNKKKIYFLNKHSDGVYNRFYWDKRLSTVPFQSVYTFTPIRGWKKILSKLSIKNQIYYE